MSEKTWRSLVPAATIIANVLSYALFLVSARLLDRATYGETLALLNLVVIATIPSFAIQTVVARRTATDTVGPRLVRVSVLIGLAGAGAILLVSPLIVSFLHLPSYWGVVGGAACVPALVLLGVLQGAAQGRRQWRTLCIAVVLMGLGRVAGGVAGLIVTHSSAGAMIGTAVGLAVAAAVMLRPTLRLLGQSPVDKAQPVKGLLIETVHAAHAHGVFLLLSSLDMTIARNVLSPDEAGWYAAGNVIFRAALWLPQPVTSLLFASLSDWARHRTATRQGLAAVGGLVAATIGACAVLGGLVSTIIAGDKFPDLDEDLWIFALAGGGLALMQFAIYAGLAALRRGRLAIVWACIVAEIIAFYPLGLSDTPVTIIATVAVIVSVATLAAITIALLTRPTADTTDTAPRRSSASMVPGGIDSR